MSRRTGNEAFASTEFVFILFWWYTVISTFSTAPGFTIPISTICMFHTGDAVWCSTDVRPKSSVSAMLVSHSHACLPRIFRNLNSANALITLGAKQQSACGRSRFFAERMANWTVWTLSANTSTFTSSVTISVFCVSGRHDSVVEYKQAE